MTKQTDREPKAKAEAESATRIRKPDGGYMTIEEFRNRIRQLCGLKPEGFYNPPVEKPITLRQKGGHK